MSFIIFHTLFALAIILTFFGVGYLISKMLNRIDLPLLSLGLSGFLFIGFIFVIISNLVSVSKIPFYICAASLVFLSFIGLILYLKEYLINQKKLNLYTIGILVSFILVALFFAQQYILYAVPFGPLESGPKFLTIINNNFYSNQWINIDLDTGLTIKSLFSECNLGFYYVVDFFLKILNRLYIINPITSGMYIFQLVLITIYFEWLCFGIDKYIKYKDSKLLLASLVWLTYGLNFYSYHYGFVSYLYLPVILGLFYCLCQYSNVQVSSKIVLFIVLFCSIMSLTTFGYVLVMLLIAIIGINHLITKYSKLVNKFIYFVLFIYVLTVIFVFIGYCDVTVFINHYGFSYYQGYLDINKNTFIFSLIVFGLAIYNVIRQKSRFLLAILTIVNPLVIYLTLNTYNQGFLIFQLFFNIGVFVLAIEPMEQYALKTNKTRLLIASMCILSLTINKNLGEDTYQLNAVYNYADRNYNSTLRISNQVNDIFSKLNELTKYQEHRVKVISQVPLTLSYVSNIELLYGMDHINGLCQYCDVVGMNLHEPNQLTNIFSYREYADNRLYIEAPSYQNACSLVNDNQYEYLILDNTQYYFNGENYYPLSNVVSSCSRVIYSNENYTLLEVFN